MRMDTTQGQTAAEWLAGASHGDIASVLREYGEERHAGRIANAILRALEARAPSKPPANWRRSFQRRNPSWKSTSIRPPARSRVSASGSTASWMTSGICWMALLICSSRGAPGDHQLPLPGRPHGQALHPTHGDAASSPPRGVPVMESQVKESCGARRGGQAERRGQSADNPRARSAVMRVAERLPEVAA